MSYDRYRKVKTIQPGNREWVIVVQGINSGGWTMPPFIIVVGQNHLEDWYCNNSCLSDWIIGINENDWTTNELGFE